MATKQEVLQQVKELARSKDITRDELLAAFNSVDVVAAEPPASKKVGAADIFYYIGGGIVFLGIAILLAQNWSTLGFATKLLATLVSGIVAYVIGLLFSRDMRTQTASNPFFLISALVTPIGLYVVFDQVGMDTSSYSVQMLSATIMTGAYVASLLLFKRTVFALFSIIFGTWLYFSITGFMAGDSQYLASWKFDAYRVLVAGLAYILLGYGLAKTKFTALRGFLYSFGLIGVLGSAIVLSGWKPDENIFWVLLSPILIFAALFMSIVLKSKAFLVWGAIFLMIYVLKITAEYFSSGIGWPFALVMAGLAMIAIGFLVVTIKRKYLSR